jgi:hypothetical protein
MILYYTGAVKNDQQQNDPSKSLGGWISSSIIPNSKLGNLFSGISDSMIQNPNTQIRVIALKNLTGETKNVTIYTDTPEDSYSIFKLGVSQPVIDPECGPYFESLSSEDSLPYMTQVEEHEGAINGITISDFANNAYLGIFIVRELKDTVPGYKAATIPCEDIAESYGQPVQTEDSISIKIDY